MFGERAGFVLFGDGAGGFDETHVIESGGARGGPFAAADLDGDGRDDVATVNDGPDGNQRNVGVLLNRLTAKQH